MNQKNILGSSLQICSTNPMTGYHRDGYCRPNKNDKGKHYVCGVMNQDFLDFTASKGNDLSSVVKSGENWCLCEDRFEEAYNAGKAPKVIKNANHKNTKNIVKNILLREGFENIIQPRTAEIIFIFYKFLKYIIISFIAILFLIDLYFYNSKYTKSFKKLIL